MIRVTVELVPYGDEEKAKVLHTVIIANDGTGNVWFGNYNVRLQTPGKEDKTAYVRGHYRRESALSLLHKALGAESGTAIGYVRKVGEE